MPHPPDRDAMTPIEKIKAIAQKSVDPALDRTVYLDSDIGIYEFADAHHHKHCYLDVPLHAIVALGRNDFFKPNETWKQALENIHATDWSNDVFDYFDSELLENKFPSPSSRQELRLICVGGACFVGNGNHRLVAAKNWLVGNSGSDAVLKKAKVSYYFLPDEVKQHLARALQEGLEVRVTEKGLNPPYRYCLHLHGRRADELWCWDGSSIKQLEESRSLSSFIFRILRIKPNFRLRWKIIPKFVVEVLLDDDWATRA